MAASISSGSLVQVNGTGCSFQLPVYAPMVSVSWRTEVKDPRRMAWRRQPGPDLGVLAGGVVVADHVQLLGGVGGGDLLQEARPRLAYIPR